MTGPLSYLLGNRAYLGEINHREISYQGEHHAIIDIDLFDRVQAIKRHGRNNDGRRGKSNALLSGLIFDDAGNHMTPIHVTKGSIRYRYYQSWVMAHGQKYKAGSVHRVPAADIENAVLEAIAKHFNEGDPELVSQANVRHLIKRIIVHAQRLELEIDELQPSPAGQSKATISILTIPWTKRSTARKRQILGDGDSQNGKPIRSKARTRLLKGIAQGRSWLDQLAKQKVKDMTALATKHSVSVKTVRSTISLAFLAPDIVQAAIEGRLPKGLGISSMSELSSDWAEQRKQLGLS